MGCNLLRRNCNSNPYAYSTPTAIAPNPNPGRFEIKYEIMAHNFLILKVHYPDCTNFEGNKILVFKGVINSQELLSLLDGKLDPHFSNTGKVQVFARFPPTDEGIDAALTMAEVLSR